MKINKSYSENFTFIKLLNFNVEYINNNNLSREGQQLNPQWFKVMEEK